MSQTKCSKCDGEGDVTCPKSDCFGGIVNPFFGDRHCKYCHGKGKVRCNKCGGTGTVDKKGKKTSYSKNTNYDYSDNSSSAHKTSNVIIYGGTGLGISIFIGIFKGCGLFSFDPQKGNAYLFDVDDALKGFLIFPIIGAGVGVILDVLRSIRER
jgi:hypothetical protein